MSARPPGHRTWSRSSSTTSGSVSCPRSAGRSTRRTSQASPRERFYGFLPGETDQWHPILTRDNTRIPTPEREGYQLSEDLVAAEQPERLAGLIELWWDEARRHHVLPLDDRGRDRFIDPTRPRASETRDVYRYYAGTSPIPNPSLPIILDCPHSFTVRCALRTRDDRGLLVSHGANLGGWALLVDGGRAVYLNNHLRLTTTELTTPRLPVGRELELRYEWVPIEAGLGTARLVVDGDVVAEASDVPSNPRGYSMVQEGLCIGRAWGPSVSHAHYDGSFAFTGDLRVVELRTDPARQIAVSER